MASPERLYNQTYHADRDARSRYAAETVLSSVFGWCDIESACDIGCGVGTWLSVASGLGAQRIAGFDGPWVQPDALVIDRAQFTQCDLNAPIPSGDRFDLAMSLEVAEHLKPERAGSLVADICGLSDLVLFSAAIPHQGGTGHINEQWPSYWAAHFADQGYAPFDVIRPLIWADDGIAWWYRQNMLLFAKEGSAPATSLAALPSGQKAQLDLVHPAQFEHAQKAVFSRTIRSLSRKVFNR